MRGPNGGGEVERQQTQIAGLRVEVTALRSDLTSVRRQLVRADKVIAGLRENVRDRDVEIALLRRPTEVEGAGDAAEVGAEKPDWARRSVPAGIEDRTVVTLPTGSRRCPTSRPTAGWPDRPSCSSVLPARVRARGRPLGGTSESLLIAGSWSPHLPLVVFLLSAAQGWRPTTKRSIEMLTKTKWILAGGAAAVALTPAAAFASGYDAFGPGAGSGIAVASVQSDSIAADAVTGTVTAANPAVDPRWTRRP